MDELIREYALPPSMSIQATADAAQADADASEPFLDRGETIRTYFYDGDTGACMRTIITDPGTR
jgi:hypothetical protein